jgi:hypothetical protein
MLNIPSLSLPPHPFIKVPSNTIMSRQLCDAYIRTYNQTVQVLFSPLIDSLHQKEKCERSLELESKNMRKSMQKKFQIDKDLRNGPFLCVLLF